MLDLLWSVGAFIVAIGVLVAFHEFGHFWVARRLGVRVLRFSIGFGRPLFGWRGRDGVEYVIAMIPLGGYVKMLDEREAPVPEDWVRQAFNRQVLWRRVAIVAAGPVFNFVLAVALYWAMYLIGVEGVRPVIAEPPAGSMAAKAGLQEGDELMSVAGRQTPIWRVARANLIDAALDGEPIRLTVKRGDGVVETVQLDGKPRSIEPAELFDSLGLSSYQPPIPPILAEIMDGSAAKAAGFQAGDELLSHDGEPIESWQDWATWVRAHPGEISHVEFKRDDARLGRAVIIGEADGQGRFGARVDVPQDLWQDHRAEFSRGPIQAVGAAVAQTWQMSVLTLRMLHRMIVGDVSVKNVSGPIQIAQFAGYSASVGIVSFLSFMAIVSVSLGVLNLLPVPMLDGGHLLFFLFEAVLGRPLSERAQLFGQQIGITMLVLLMGLAFYNDIMRLIG